MDCKVRKHNDREGVTLLRATNNIKPPNSAYMKEGKD